MRERPILFSAPMVRAILEGRKTQTRRVAKAAERFGLSFAVEIEPGVWGDEEGELEMRCPYGQPGDRLWVREAHSIFSTYGQHRADGKRWGPWADLPTMLSPDMTQIAYFREGFDRCDPGRWRPSIHMPRWACRLVLEVTGVRVERLHGISDEDCIAEGCSGGHDSIPDYRYNALPSEHFRWLWNSINGPDSWDANPWVWVVHFKRVDSGQGGDA